MLTHSLSAQCQKLKHIFVHSFLSLQDGSSKSFEFSSVGNGLICPPHPHPWPFRPSSRLNWLRHPPLLPVRLPAGGPALAKDHICRVQRDAPLRRHCAGLIVDRVALLHNGASILARRSPGSAGRTQGTQKRRDARRAAELCRLAHRQARIFTPETRPKKDDEVFQLEATAKKFRRKRVLAGYAFDFLQRLEVQPKAARPVQIEQNVART